MLVFFSGGTQFQRLCHLVPSLINKMAIIWLRHSVKEDLVEMAQYHLKGTSNESVELPVHLFSNVVLCKS